MDELLHQLLKKVSQQKVGSQEHTIALEHLLALVPLLPNILQDDRPEYSKALDKTLKDVRQKIHQWLEIANVDIENIPATALRKRFVNWVNMFLKWDICDLNRTLKPPLSLDNPIGGEEGGITHKDRLPDILTTEDCLEQQEFQKQCLVLKRYIERDPQGKLRQCYPRDRPQCHCQALAKERYFNNPQMTVPGLAKKFGIHEQTIYSRWNRHCLRILREVVDNYYQYLYLLEPVPLSQWFQGVFDSTWPTIESTLGTNSAYLGFAE